ncbi:hypothetical protein [Porcipelethomonas sp.]|uniref:hypothetical protein n=1 Tax=Porcipelethomonas sp. TaxID=2981675 RepID=UPI003EF1E0C2
MAETFWGNLNGNNFAFDVKDLKLFGSNKDIVTGKCSSYYAYVGEIEKEIIIDSATFEALKKKFPDKEENE